MQCIRTNRFGTSTRPEVGHTPEMLERHQEPTIKISLLHILCQSNRTVAQHTQTYVQFLLL